MSQAKRVILFVLLSLFLVGCESGGDFGSPSGSTSGPQGGGGQPANGFPITGQIVPPQPGFPLSSLQVLNSATSASVNESGAFTTYDFAQTGGQLMFVVDENDNVVYAAFQEDGQQVGPRTTAQVLLYFYAKVFALPPNLHLAVRQQLLNVAELDALETAIAQALAQDPANGLASPAVTSAVQAALDSMRARAQTANRLLIDPSTEQSGITPIAQGANQVAVMNAFRRPAWAYVTKVATKADDGPEVAVNPPEAIANFEVPAIVGANSFASATVDAAVVLYSQFVDNIRSGPVAGEPVTTSPVSLPTEDGVTITYSLEVVGPGLSGPAPSDPAQREKLKELTLKFAAQQFLAFLTNVLFNVGSDQIDGLSAQTSDFSLILTDFVNLLTTLVPNVAARAEAGDLNGVLETIWSFALSDSATERAALTNLVFFVGERIGPRFGATAPNNSRFFTVMRKFALITNVVDGVLTSADTAFAGASMVNASLYTQYDVKSIADRVRLTPLNPVLKIDDEQQFTATVPSVTLEQNQFLEFHWRRIGNSGTLRAPTGSMINDFTTSQTTGPIYTAEDEGTDTIEVTVTLIDVGENIETELGTASTTVTVEDEGDEENILVNGDFTAAGSSWSQVVVSGGSFSGFPHFLFGDVAPFLPGQTGNPYFAIDVPGAASGYLEQIVTLPDDEDVSSIRLECRVWGALQTVNAFASAGGLVDTFTPALVEADPSQGDETRILDITSLKGQTVAIRIGGTSGGGNGTFANFDDVAVIVVR